jgi:hypothetical protein
VQLENSIKLFESFLDNLAGISLKFTQYPYCFVDGATNTANFVVNSCMPGTKLAQGFIGHAQLNKLTKQIEFHKTNQRKIVVTLHHHPIENNFALLLKDAEEFLSAMSNRCDFLLFGHKHQAAQWRDVYGIKHIFAADQSPSAKRYRKIDVATGRFDWVSID